MRTDYVQLLKMAAASLRHASASAVMSSEASGSKVIVVNHNRLNLGHLGVSAGMRRSGGHAPQPQSRGRSGRCGRECHRVSLI